MPADSSTFYVIERPESRVYFDTRSGSWRRALEEVQTFQSLAFACACVREWMIEGNAVVVPYRMVRHERPQPMDEPGET